MTEPGPSPDDVGILENLLNSGHNDVAKANYKTELELDWTRCKIEPRSEK